MFLSQLLFPAVIDTTWKKIWLRVLFQKYLKHVLFYDSPKTSLITIQFPFFIQYLLSYTGGWWLKSPA